MARCQLILSAQAATALPATIPADWRGIYLEGNQSTSGLRLSNILPDDVTLEDFFIGSGGFCGKVTGNLDAGMIRKTPSMRTQAIYLDFDFMKALGIQ